MKKWKITDRKLQDIRKHDYESKINRHKNPKKKKRFKLISSSRDLKHLSKMSAIRSKLKKNVKEITFKTPEIFSAIENPIETLEFISKIAKVTHDKNIKVIKLDHSSLKDHDLAAEILLGITAKEIKKAAKYRNMDIIFEGTYPENERQKRLIQAIGVVNKLNIENELRRSDIDIEIFEFNGAKVAQVKPGEVDRKNKCAKRFVDHVNNCLKHRNRKLTDTAVQALVTFIGEIIGNAEDHSGEQKWYVCGYLDDWINDHADSTELHFCEIVIFNFGKSIAKTFLELPQDSFAMQQIAPFVAHHTKNNFFSTNWHKGDLITLAALQSHISSKNLDSTTNRGQGTVDFIEFFQKIADECSNNIPKTVKMALITGKTHILFDDKYRIMPDHTGREIIAFNEQNDLNFRPDAKYVKHLKNVEFPGTVIGIKFPLMPSDTVSTGAKDTKDEQSEK